MYIPSGGIPRLAVLPNPKDPKKYDLHMYTWAPHELKHYIAVFETDPDPKASGRYIVKWRAGQKVTYLDKLFQTSKFSPPAPTQNVPPLFYHPGDMAIVYNWEGPITNRHPVLRFYFQPESSWGQFKGSLICATTTDGHKFTPSSVTFPAKYGDNGWVTVPHAIRMLNGQWWMYYVGNIPAVEYELAKTRPVKPPVTPHSTRIQYSTDNGVNWSPKIPSGAYPYHLNPPQDPLSSYNSHWGLYNTRVDPDVVYLEEPHRTAHSNPPPPKYRMYVKGEYNFEVTESRDGLEWGPLTKLTIGKEDPTNNLDWKKKPLTGLPDNYDECFDPTVIRIPSIDEVYMFYVKTVEVNGVNHDEIQYARLK